MSNINRLKHSRVNRDGRRIYAIVIDMDSSTLYEFERYRRSLSKELKRKVSRREAQERLVKSLESTSSTMQYAKQK